MTGKQVAAHYGSKAEAGRQLGITAAAISMWIRRGGVPALQQLRIQQKTKGALKVDLQARAELRRYGIIPANA